VLPRIRDFRGLSTKSFDGRGNYTIGLTEQIVFPEINIEAVEFVQGMDITLVVTGNSNEQSRELLKLLGMPFKLE
jgi:large subunit ribosomal protein L5